MADRVHPRFQAELPRKALLTVAAAVLVSLVGCGPADEPAAPPAQQEAEYQGLTPEEIQMQSEPMTLEEAERLGIVDTTIRIEPPMDPDSVVHIETEILPVTPAEANPRPDTMP